jgi:hypothetical protein
MIKEFQRLKDEESNSKRIDWDFQRTLSKINYRIHTDAIKEKLRVEFDSFVGKAGGNRATPEALTLKSFQTRFENLANPGYIYSIILEPAWAAG